MTTINVAQANGSVIGFDGAFSGAVEANVDGSVTIDVRDLAVALGGGFLPLNSRVQQYLIGNATTPVGAAAASATHVVNDQALANGTLAIAAQPDVPRQLKVAVTPGAAIAAGELVVVYDANDGTVQTDTFSLIMPDSTTDFFFTKGAYKVISATVSGLVGGSTPTIDIGTTTTLAVPVGQTCLDATMLLENLDGTYLTTGTMVAPGLFTPATAPNGTHVWSVDYSTLSVG